MNTLFALFFAILNLILLEVSLLHPSFFWWAAALTLTATTFSIWLASRLKLNKTFLNFLISPFIFWLGGLAFLGFLDNFLVKQLVIVFLTGANSYFLYRLIILTYHRHQHKDHSLSNISRIINLAGLFFWFTSSFDVYVFLKTPLWLLFILGGLVVYLIDYQFFIINKIRYSAARLFILTAVFVLLEIFYVLSWLPFMSAAKGLLMVSAYYFINSLAKYHLQGLLAKSVYLRYALITGAIWALTLLTVRLE